MKRAVSFLLVFFLLMNITGCEGLKRKFTRKKKEAVKMPRIYQAKKYTKTPSPELYKKHFAYWQSWQSELISVLGENHKKDMRCAEEVVGQLKDMQGILVPEKAEEMKPHIEKMVKVKDMIFNEEMSVANREYIRSTLEREDRLINKEFSYTKVKDFLRKSFDDEPKDAG